MRTVILAKDMSLWYGDHQALKNVSIEIPESVTNIGARAFFRCDALESISFEMGSLLSSLGANAFYECQSLNNVMFDANAPLTTINSGTFQGCTSLETIVIPIAVTTIKSQAFYYDGIITNVYYGGTAEQWNTLYQGSISPSMFFNNGLKNAICYYYSETAPEVEGNFWHYDENGNVAVWPEYVPEELEYTLSPDRTYYMVSGIGTYKSSEIVIPATYNGLPVKSIGPRAFGDCKSLTSVSFAENSQVQYISANAFEYCYNLKKIHIPTSVKSIELRAFDACTGLSSIFYGGTAEEWEEIYINTEDEGNYFITETSPFYYSEEKPTESGIFWHYDEDGNIAYWEI